MSDQRTQAASERARGGVVPGGGDNDVVAEGLEILERLTVNRAVGDR